MSFELSVIFCSSLPFLHCFFFSHFIRVASIGFTEFESLLEWSNPLDTFINRMCFERSAHHLIWMDISPKYKTKIEPMPSKSLDRTPCYRVFSTIVFMLHAQIPVYRKAYLQLIFWTTKTLISMSFLSIRTRASHHIFDSNNKSGCSSSTSQPINRPCICTKRQCIFTLPNACSPLVFIIWSGKKAKSSVQVWIAVGIFFYPNERRLHIDGDRWLSISIHLQYFISSYHSVRGRSIFHSSSIDFDFYLYNSAIIPPRSACLNSESMIGLKEFSAKM